MHFSVPVARKGNFTSSVDWVTIVGSQGDCFVCVDLLIVGYLRVEGVWEYVAFGASVDFQVNVFAMYAESAVDLVLVIYVVGVHGVDDESIAESITGISAFIKFMTLPIATLLVRWP